MYGIGSLLSIQDGEHLENSLYQENSLDNQSVQSVNAVKPNKAHKMIGFGTPIAKRLRSRHN